MNISLMAQNANRGQRPERQMPPRERMVSPQQRADRMAKELNLSDEQKAKVTELFTQQDEVRAKKRAEIQKKQEKRRDVAQAEREKMREEVEKIRKTQDAELEKIIGKEKMELLVQKRAEQVKRMNENRDRRDGMRKGNRR